MFSDSLDKVLWAILFIVYALWALSIGIRYFFKDVKVSNLWRRFERSTESINLLLYIFLAALAFILIVICLSLAAPFFWHSLRKIKAEEKATLAEKENKRVSEAYEKVKVNKARSDTRRKWLNENQIVLYHSSDMGITAVVRPQDYAETVKETSRLRRNGLWEVQILFPAKKTFVFVNKQGLEKIYSAAGQPKKIKREAELDVLRATGWISQLDEVVATNDIKLVEKENIFIPWLDENSLSFQEQMELINPTTTGPLTYELVEMQTPEEMRPITQGKTQ